MGHQRQLWIHAGIIAGERVTAKTCRTCKVEKPLRSFYRYKGSKDGRLNQCKRCFLAARAKREAEKCINSAWTDD